jgi:hypothetical protein
LQDPGLRAELRARREARRTESAGQLSALRDKALRVLDQALEGDNTTDRLRAAKLAFEWDNRSSRDIDLVDRINELEDAVRQAKEDE